MSCCKSNCTVERPSLVSIETGKTKAGHHSETEPRQPVRCSFTEFQGCWFDTDYGIVVFVLSTKKSVENLSKLAGKSLEKYLMSVYGIVH